MANYRFYEDRINFKHPDIASEAMNVLRAAEAFNRSWNCTLGDGDTPRTAQALVDALRSLKRTAGIVARAERPKAKSQAPARSKKEGSRG